MAERESTHEVAEATEKGRHIERTTTTQNDGGERKTEKTVVTEEGEARQVKPDGR